MHAYVDLAETANSTTPVILAEFLGANGESYKGNWLITSFAKTGEQNGVVEFTIALQNEGVITYTAGT